MIAGGGVLGQTIRAIPSCAHYGIESKKKKEKKTERI